jgi:hypothetical protein
MLFKEIILMKRVYHSLAFLLFVMVFFSEARSTKHEARSTKHEALTPSPPTSLKQCLQNAISGCENKECGKFLCGCGAYNDAWVYDKCLNFCADRVCYIKNVCIATQKKLCYKKFPAKPRFREAIRS